MPSSALRRIVRDGNRGLHRLQEHHRSRPDTRLPCRFLQRRCQDRGGVSPTEVRDPGPEEYRRGLAATPDRSFSWSRAWRNREYRALLGIAAVVAILALKAAFLPRPVVSIPGPEPGRWPSRARPERRDRRVEGRIPSHEPRRDTILPKHPPPMTFRDISGHRRLKRLLTRAVHAGSLPPSLVFAGPDGVGKRQAALALAQALNCLDPVVDAASGEQDACGACGVVPQDRARAAPGRRAGPAAGGQDGNRDQPDEGDQPAGELPAVRGALARGRRRRGRRARRGLQGRAAQDAGGAAAPQRLHPGDVASPPAVHDHPVAMLHAQVRAALRRGDRGGARLAPRIRRGRRTEGGGPLRRQDGPRARGRGRRARRRAQGGGGRPAEGRAGPRGPRAPATGRRSLEGGGEEGEDSGEGREGAGRGARVAWRRACARWDPCCATWRC